MGAAGSGSGADGVPDALQRGGRLGKRRRRRRFRGVVDAVVIWRRLHGRRPETALRFEVEVETPAQAAHIRRRRRRRRRRRGRRGATVDFERRGKIEGIGPSIARLEGSLQGSPRPVSPRGAFRIRVGVGGVGGVSAAWLLAASAAAAAAARAEAATLEEASRRLEASECGQRVSSATGRSGRVAN